MHTYPYPLLHEYFAVNRIDGQSPVRWCHKDTLQAPCSSCCPVELRRMLGLQPDCLITAVPSGRLVFEQFSIVVSVGNTGPS